MKAVAVFIVTFIAVVLADGTDQLVDDEVKIRPGIRLVYNQALNVWEQHVTSQSTQHTCHRGIII